MPGNVKTIDVSTLDTFPGVLYTAYAVNHQRHVIGSQYPDGTVQVASDVDTAQKTWRIAMKLTATQLSTVREFYYAHLAKPFLFQDLHTGQRFKAVFTSPWQETSALGRSPVSLELHEIY